MIAELAPAQLEGLGSDSLVLWHRSMHDPLEHHMPVNNTHDTQRLQTPTHIKYICAESSARCVGCSPDSIVERRTTREHFIH